LKSIPQGAATTVLAAVGQRFEGQGGVFLEDCAISKPLAEGNAYVGSSSGHAKWVYDQAGAKHLWDLSLQLVGLPEEK